MPLGGRIQQAAAVDRDMAVFTFEGPTVLYVHRSVPEAEGYFEPIDVENDEYVFFGADGTPIRPSVRDGRVVLTPTVENRSGELRERLRQYLARPGMAMDGARADDPVALAGFLLERERGRRRAGRLGRILGRRAR
jgi:hypothetical protein